MPNRQHRLYLGIEYISSKRGKERKAGREVGWGRENMRKEIEKEKKKPGEGIIIQYNNQDIAVRLRL